MKLTDEEMEKLKTLLDKIDREVYRVEGWHYHSGGFATCELDDYNEDNIFVTIKHGIQNDVENRVYSDPIIIDRKTMTVWKD